ncbi:MAG: M20/M25/M40 family metallo-hydrolase [Phycisphaerae bacterium]
MRKESLEFLRELMGTPSMSGFETPGQKLWCDYARKIADDVTTDSYGNAVAVLNPKGSPKVLLDGHIDEIGLMVKYVDENGFIYFQRVGGVDAALMRSKRVNIHGRKGVVRGVIGATPVHLQERGKEPKVPKMHDLFIDVGAADGAAAGKLVQVGDPITFEDQFELLNDNVAVARAFDDRAGTWAVIEAMRLAKAAGAKCAIHASSSIQEETGLNGAKMHVVRIKPDAAIAVEVSHAIDVPGLDKKQHGEVKMGEGPTVSIGRENHPALVERVRRVAKRKRIKYQVEAYSQSGGTDAQAFWIANGGVPSMVLGIPNRYMHSTVEMLDLRDLQKAAELLAAFCADLKKRDRFVVKV